MAPNEYEQEEAQDCSSKEMTIQTEINHIQSLLSEIENKMFEAESETADNECSPNKILNRRNDLNEILVRLEKINSALKIL